MAGGGEPPAWGAREAAHMRAALSEARAAGAAGEVPVGCVLVGPAGGGGGEGGSGGGAEVVLARGHNLTNAARNGTRHAELVAVDAALAAFPDLRWEECEFFVSLEPCLMCAGALALLGPKRVWFGGTNDKFGGCGGVLDVSRGCGRCGEGGGRAPGFSFTGGLMADESVGLLKEFYEAGNPRAPQPHRKAAVQAQRGVAE